MPRTVLSLSDKFKLIELRREKWCTEELIFRFKCGKTQVYDAIKNKEKIMVKWVNSKNLGKNKRMKTFIFKQVVQVVYQCSVKKSANFQYNLQAEAMKLV